jgi:proteasome lid subunit RPN8/RPN11
MKEHGRTSMRAEVCGILVGNLYWDDAPFLMVENSIIGKHAVSNVTTVTFTDEMWVHVWKEHGENYPDTRIIGWYHTHPGFGIFLSSYDVHTFKSTFYAPHQVAYVYDPKSDQEGWFIWKNSVPTRVKALIIEDVEGFVLPAKSTSMIGKVCESVARALSLKREESIEELAVESLTEQNSPSQPTPVVSKDEDVKPKSKRNDDTHPPTDENGAGSSTDTGEVSPNKNM